MRKILLAALIVFQAGVPGPALAESPTQKVWVIPGVHVEAASVQKELSPLIELRTSHAAWQKICGRPDSLCGEPESLGYAGPLLFIILPLVWIADILVGIFTVPYDILATPFRERRLVTIRSWKIYGRIADRSGVLPNYPIRVRVSLMPPDRVAWSLGGQAWTTTDATGEFSTLVSGLGTAKPDNRIDVDVEGAKDGRPLARTCCVNAVDPTKTPPVTAPPLP